MDIQDLYLVMLATINLLLFQIAWDIHKIEKRTKERFPTEKEADYEWARKDPMGHSEAHKKDASSKGKRLKNTHASAPMACRIRKFQRP